MSAFYDESANKFLVLEHCIIPSRTQNLLLVSIEKNFTKRIPFFANLVSLKAFFLYRYFSLEKTVISVKNVDLNAQFFCIDTPAAISKRIQKKPRLR